MTAKLLMKLKAVSLRVVKKGKLMFASALAISAFSMLSVNASAVELGVQAPDFEMKTFSGETFKLSDYRGKKPVYLVFWATWCPICKAEIPHIKKIHAQLGDKVEMLAINVGFEDTLEKAQHYVKEHQLPYDVSFDENTVITKRYGVVGTPWQVVIDINGTVRYFSNNTPTNIADHLDSLLQKNN